MERSEAKKPKKTVTPVLAPIDLPVHGYIARRSMQVLTANVHYTYVATQQLLLLLKMILAY